MYLFGETMEIDYRQAMPREKRLLAPFVPEGVLPFGKLRSDHLVVTTGEVQYESDGKTRKQMPDGSDVVEWETPRIVPYQELSSKIGVPIFPGSTVLNYGQGIFEGAKAFQHDDGELRVFRLDVHAERLNRSADRLCIPRIPVDLQQQAIHALLDIDRLWFPQQAGASLYVRPVVIGIDDLVRVGESKRYAYYAFLSPSGPYFGSGVEEPISLFVSKKFHRAGPGGTGAVKSIGNYPGTFLPARLARERYGAQQVLYIDVTNTHIDEAGAMNHYHLTTADELVIPEFTETILASITARSLLELAAAGRLPVTARQTNVNLERFLDGVRQRRITAAGACGSAAVLAPVKEYILESGEHVQVADGKVDQRTRDILSVYRGIQHGTEESPEGWMQLIERRTA